MSRKTLSFIVGGLGIVAAFTMLVAINLMGSWLADARTENAAGPGVDVFLHTPFPTPGSELELEVVARGGSRAGIYEIGVFDGRELLTRATGRGATWGYTITKGKSRGSDGETVRFAVPSRLSAGETLGLDIDVSYVVAMSSGHSFSNDRHNDRVHLDVAVLASAGPARLLLAARSIVLFALWLGLVLGVTWLFNNAEGPAGDEQLAGIGLLMGLMGGGLVGYWFFARPLMSALDLRSTLFEVLFTLLWVVLPLWLAWRWSKSIAKLQRYFLRGPMEMDVRDLATCMPAAAGTQVRQRADGLDVKRGKSRMRVRWSGQRVALDKLDLRATEVRLPLELAHRAAGRLGKLVLAPHVGPALEVDPARTVEAIEGDYFQAMVAEAQRMLKAMGQLRLKP